MDDGKQASYFQARQLCLMRGTARETTGRTRRVGESSVAVERVIYRVVPGDSDVY